MYAQIISETLNKTEQEEQQKFFNLKPSPHPSQSPKKHKDFPLEHS